MVKARKAKTLHRHPRNTSSNHGIAEGNYARMAQILTSIALYEVLQAHGAGEGEAYRAVSEEMWTFLDPSGKQMVP